VSGRLAQGWSLELRGASSSSLAREMGGDVDDGREAGIISCQRSRFTSNCSGMSDRFKLGENSER
jgi:hypothetical protein